MPKNDCDKMKRKSDEKKERNKLKINLSKKEQNSE